MKKKSPSTSSKVSTKTVTTADNRYNLYGGYTLFQLAALLLPVLVQPFPWVSLDGVIVLALAAYFSWLAWVFFSRQPYADQASKVAAGIIVVLAILQVLSGNYMIIGSIVGFLIYSNFDKKTLDAQGKPTGSVIYSGNEFSGTSLRNYGILIGVIAVSALVVYLVIQSS